MEGQSNGEPDKAAHDIVKPTACGIILTHAFICAMTQRLAWKMWHSHKRRSFSTIGPQQPRFVDNESIGGEDMFEFHTKRAYDILKDTELVYDAQAVQAAVSQVAGELNRRFGQANSPSYPLVLGVMGGAVIFTGQLLPQLTFPLEYDYIHVSRYGDDDKGGALQWKVVPRQNVKDRTVIVVDDILDEGETLAEVKKRLLSLGAKNVVLTVFADKQIGKKKAVTADVVGLTVPNQFVIGFGMDTHGYWRNLPEIRVVKIR